MVAEDFVGNHEVVECKLNGCFEARSVIVSRASMRTGTLTVQAEAPSAAPLSTLAVQASHQPARQVLHRRVFRQCST